MSVRNLGLMRAAAILLAVAAGWTTARAGGSDDFTLTKAIPADAYLAVHTRGHDGQAFVNKQYERVWHALEKANIDRDLRRLFKDLNERGGGDADDFEKRWQQMTDLLAGVEWSTLCEKECAYAMKWEGKGPESMAPEGILLLRPKADRINEDFEGLSAILKTIAGFDENSLQFSEEKQGDLAVRKLSMSGAPFPYGLVVARYKDTLILSFGSTWFEQSLAMLQGQAGSTLASTARFKEAFKRLPDPTDAMVFFDMARMFNGMRGMINATHKMMKAGGEDDAAEGEDAKAQEQVMAVPLKIVDAVDMFDYMATVATTKGMKTSTDSVVVLKADASKKPFYAAIFGGGPISDPLKYVPKTARNVSVSTGVDWSKLYQATAKFVRDEVPDGGAAIDELEGALEGMGLDIDKDLLGWLEGPMINFSIPGATTYSPGEFVMMLKVRDEKKAGEMIDRAVAAVTPLLEQQNGSIGDVEIAGAGGFHSIIHPLIGMIGMREPTIGVRDGMLFMASSPKIIETSLQVAAGKADGFDKNERFLAEGLKPAAKVMSFSFADQADMGKELGQGLKMAPLIANFMGPSATKEPVARAIIGILTKLGPVVEKLDFFSSSCSQSVMDGSVIRTQEVTTYREPPVEKAPASQPDSASKGASSDAGIAGGK